MSKIPEHTLEEIQQRCDIVDLIGQYIPLKKAGRNFKALCPFHHEKTPSFTVNPDKQIFHCFGCGVGGDVFAFIMKHERLEFPEAVAQLAERSGVVLETPPESAAAPSTSQAAALYKINELAARFFQAQLEKSAAAGPARAYLEERGITGPTAQLFRLGYALSGWDSLRTFLQSRRVPESFQEQSGLVVRGSQGKLYDRFRNRVMFPIANAQGKIVGFGGRLLPGAAAASRNEGAQPKYVNSPETAVYSKGRMLYGLNVSKSEIPRRDAVLVVEGYFDMIVPYQAGVRNIVASLGTAFTPEQVRLLKRYTRTVVLVYDADTAGQDASLRSLEMLLIEGMDVRVASLTAGDDPDAYVRRYGADAFRALADQAASLFDYSLHMYRQRFGGTAPEAAGRVAAAMLGLVGRVKEPVLRALYVRRLSEALNISEQLICEELHRQKEPGRRSSSMPAARRATSAEHLLVMMLVSGPERIALARQELNPEEFSDPAVREIIQQLYASTTEASATLLMQRLATEEARQLLAEVLAADWGVEDEDKAFAQCLRRIKADGLDVNRKQILHEIQTLSSQGGSDEDINRRQREYGRLTKELQTYGKADKGKI